MTRLNTFKMFIITKAARKKKLHKNMQFKIRQKPGCIYFKSEHFLGAHLICDSVNHKINPNNTITLFYSTDKFKRIHKFSATFKSELAKSSISDNHLTCLPHCQITHPISHLHLTIVSGHKTRLTVPFHTQQIADLNMSSSIPYTIANL